MTPLFLSTSFLIASMNKAFNKVELSICFCALMKIHFLVNISQTILNPNL
jgi:hypothetical protein